MQLKEFLLLLLGIMLGCLRLSIWSYIRNTLNNPCACNVHIHLYLPHSLYTYVSFSDIVCAFACAYLYKIKLKTYI